MDDTSRIYAAAGIGGELRRGTRPAVVVVDLQRGFTEAEGPVGTDLSDVVGATRALLDVARDSGVPVLFTTISYGTPLEAGVWSQKMPGLLELTDDGPWVELDPRLGRRPAEPCLGKRGASAAFGTNLTSVLTSLAVDTVIVTGATTSGCVRATVVDLCMAGFPVLVPPECCGDRARGPHEANLLDMAAKYADVVPAASLADYLRDLVRTRESERTCRRDSA